MNRKLSVLKFNFSLVLHQADSEEVKLMWVKEIRNLTQQFQFGLLQPRGNLSAFSTIVFNPIIEEEVFVLL